MTSMRHVGAATIAAVACLVLSVVPCSAEWLADIYVGTGFSQNQDIRVNDKSVGPGTLKDVEFDLGLAYGGRFGWFFEAVPFLGLAVDFFNVSTYLAPQDVTVSGCSLLTGCAGGRAPTGSFEVDQTALSLDVLLRVPIGRTKERPAGWVQPYIGMGVPVVLTSINPVNTRLFRNHDGDSDLSFGYKGEAGIAVSVYRNLMVFGEYRYLHAEPEFQLRSYANGHHSTLRTDLDTHSALVGLSARW